MTTVGIPRSLSQAVHQKCAVIFGIELTWQDTDNIEASIYGNPILEFLVLLCGSRLHATSIWLSADAGNLCSWDVAGGSGGETGRRVDGIRASTQSHKQKTEQVRHVLMMMIIHTPVH
jgi:hypothetical protein